MPGSMNGIKLAAAVRDPWPPIKIVATSGRVKLGVDDLPMGALIAAWGPLLAISLKKTLRG
jgi:hypothetical protein